jgi:hypothetical protein
MEYQFEQTFSLQPNQLSLYNTVFVRDYHTKEFITLAESKSKFRKLNILKDDKSSIKRKPHNFLISKNAYRTLKTRINWLYYLSNKRQIMTYNKKIIYNFRLGFLTLTLPSKQKTCTKDVTSNILNVFLTEIRQRTKMKNYVWRLEFQKNGNVHYHIITDTYIDYYLAKTIWNRILASHGYIDDYANKMSKISLSSYINKYNSNNTREYSEMVKTYARCKREKWSNPPTVNVKSVQSSDAISHYLTKYFSKGNDISTACNSLDNPENSSNLRLWFCSRSLSKMKSISEYICVFDVPVELLISYAKKQKTKVFDYAKCIYFETSSIIGNARKWIEKLYKDYSLKQGYLPAF